MAVETENTAPTQRPVEQKAVAPPDPKTLATNPNEPTLYPAIPFTSVQFTKSWAQTCIPTQTPQQVTLFAQELIFTILHSEELKGINHSERKWLFQMWERIERAREDLEFDLDGLDEKRIDDKEKWMNEKRVELGKAFEFARSHRELLKDVGSGWRSLEFWRWVEAGGKGKAEEKEGVEDSENEEVLC